MPIMNSRIIKISDNELEIQRYSIDNNRVEEQDETIKPIKVKKSLKQRVKCLIKRFRKGDYVCFGLACLSPIFCAVATFTLIIGVQGIILASIGAGICFVCQSAVVLMVGNRVLKDNE